MASIDHTAHAHLLARNAPKSKSTLSADSPLNPTYAERERRLSYTSRLAGTALAVAVMEGILKSHRAWKQANGNGQSNSPSPLNPVQLIGLETAIDLLHHYVDLLAPEKGG